MEPIINHEITHLRGIFEVPWSEPVYDNTGARVMQGKIPVVGPTTRYAVLLGDSDEARLFRTRKEAEEYFAANPAP